MKRVCYISAFVFLGLLVATLIHAVVEIPLLNLIFGDDGPGPDSWWWQNWEMSHYIGSLVLWVAGAVVGYWLGVRYWRILYIEKRYGEKKW